MVWPAFSIPHGDQISIATRLLDMLAPAVEVALVVAIAGCEVKFDQPLFGSPASVAFSGWKSFDAFEEGHVRAWLPLSADRSYDVYLLSRSPGGTADPERSWVEWMSCSVADVGSPDSVSDAPGKIVSEAEFVTKPDTKLPNLCLFRDIGIIEHFVGSEDYEHIALRLFNLSFAGRQWPQFDFKVSNDSGVPGVEFRPFEGEPPFVVWPSDTVDAYGPVFKIHADKVVGASKRKAVMARLTPIDQRFLRALGGAIPGMLSILSDKMDDSANAQNLKTKPDWEKWTEFARKVADYFSSDSENLTESEATEKVS